MATKEMDVLQPQITTGGASSVNGPTSTLSASGGVAFSSQQSGTTSAFAGMPAQPMITTLSHSAMSSLPLASSGLNTVNISSNTQRTLTADPNSTVLLSGSRDTGDRDDGSTKITASRKETVGLNKGGLILNNEAVKDDGTGSQSNDNKIKEPRICCCIENGRRCQLTAGNASFTPQLQAAVSQQSKLELKVDPAADHMHICDHHKAKVRELKNYAGNVGDLYVGSEVPVKPGTRKLPPLSSATNTFVKERELAVSSATASATSDAAPEATMLPHSVVKMNAISSPSRDIGRITHGDKQSAGKYVKVTGPDATTTAPRFVGQLSSATSANVSGSKSSISSTARSPTGRASSSLNVDNKFLVRSSGSFGSAAAALSTSTPSSIASGSSRPLNVKENAAQFVGSNSKNRAPIISGGGTKKLLSVVSTSPLPTKQNALQQQMHAGLSHPQHSPETTAAFVAAASPQQKHAARQKLLMAPSNSRLNTGSKSPLASPLSTQPSAAFADKPPLMTSSAAVAASANKSQQSSAEVQLLSQNTAPSPSSNLKIVVKRDKKAAAAAAAAVAAHKVTDFRLKEQVGSSNTLAINPATAAAVGASPQILTTNMDPSLNLSNTINPAVVNATLAEQHRTHAAQQLLGSIIRNSSNAAASSGPAAFVDQINALASEVAARINNHNLGLSAAANQKQHVVTSAVPSGDVAVNTSTTTTADSLLAMGADALALLSASAQPVSNPAASSSSSAPSREASPKKQKHSTGAKNLADDGTNMVLATDDNNSADNGNDDADSNVCTETGANYDVTVPKVEQHSAENDQTVVDGNHRPPSVVAGGTAPAASSSGSSAESARSLVKKSKGRRGGNVAVAQRRTKTNITDDGVESMQQLTSLSSLPLKEEGRRRRRPKRMDDDEEAHASAATTVTTVENKHSELFAKGAGKRRKRPRSPSVNARQRNEDEADDDDEDELHAGYDDVEQIKSRKKRDAAASERYREGRKRHYKRRSRMSSHYRRNRKDAAANEEGEKFIEPENRSANDYLWSLMRNWSGDQLRTYSHYFGFDSRLAPDELQEKSFGNNVNKKETNESPELSAASSSRTLGASALSMQKEKQQQQRLSKLSKDDLAQACCEYISDYKPNDLSRLAVQFFGRVRDSAGDVSALTSAAAPSFASSSATTGRSSNKRRGTIRPPFGRTFRTAPTKVDEGRSTDEVLANGEPHHDPNRRQTIQKFITTNRNVINEQAAEGAGFAADGNEGENDDESIAARFLHTYDNKLSRLMCVSVMKFLVPTDMLMPSSSSSAFSAGSHANAGRFQKLKRLLSKMWLVRLSDNTPVCTVFDYIINKNQFPATAVPVDSADTPLVAINADRLKTLIRNVPSQERLSTSTSLSLNVEELEILEPFGEERLVEQVHAYVERVRGKMLAKSSSQSLVHHQTTVMGVYLSPSCNAAPASSTSAVKQEHHSTSSRSGRRREISGADAGTPAATTTTSAAEYSDMSDAEMDEQSSAATTQVPTVTNKSQHYYGSGKLQNANSGNSRNNYRRSSSSLNPLDYISSVFADDDIADREDNLMLCELLTYFEQLGSGSSHPAAIDMLQRLRASSVAATANDNNVSGQMPNEASSANANCMYKIVVKGKRLAGSASQLGEDQNTRLLQHTVKSVAALANTNVSKEQEEDDVEWIEVWPSSSSTHRDGIDTGNNSKNEKHAPADDSSTSAALPDFDQIWRMAFGDILTSKAGPNSAIKNERRKSRKTNTNDAGSENGDRSDADNNYGNVQQDDKRFILNSRKLFDDDDDDADYDDSGDSDFEIVNDDNNNNDDEAEKDADKRSETTASSGSLLSLTQKTAQNAASDVVTNASGALLRKNVKRNAATPATYANNTADPQPSPSASLLLDSLFAAATSTSALSTVSSDWKTLRERPLLSKNRNNVIKPSTQSSSSSSSLLDFSLPSKFNLAPRKIAQLLNDSVRRRLEHSDAIADKQAAAAVGSISADVVPAALAEQSASHDYWLDYCDEIIAQQLIALRADVGTYQGDDDGEEDSASEIITDRQQQQNVADDDEVEEDDDETTTTTTTTTTATAGVARGSSQRKKKIKPVSFDNDDADGVEREVSKNRRRKTIAAAASHRKRKDHADMRNKKRMRATSLQKKSSIIKEMPKQLEENAITGDYDDDAYEEYDFDNMYPTSSLSSLSSATRSATNTNSSYVSDSSSSVDDDTNQRRRARRGSPDSASSSATTASSTTTSAASSSTRRRVTAAAAAAAETAGNDDVYNNNNVSQTTHNASTSEASGSSRNNNNGSNNINTIAAVTGAADGATSATSSTVNHHHYSQTSSSSNNNSSNSSNTTSTVTTREGGFSETLSPQSAASSSSSSLPLQHQQRGGRKLTRLKAPVNKKKNGAVDETLQLNGVLSSRKRSGVAQTSSALEQQQRDLVNNDFSSPSKSNSSASTSVSAKAGKFFRAPQQQQHSTVSNASSKTVGRNASAVAVAPADAVTTTS